MSAMLLKGAPVAAALHKKTEEICLACARKGVAVTLAVVRVGENPADLSYERSLLRAAEKCGVTVRSVPLPAEISAGEFYSVLRTLAADESVHGMLLFRPLPAALDEREACALIPPAKDVDCAREDSLASVFIGGDTGFAPCTAQACMEILKFYDIPLRGARAAVLGRSLVIGKPVAMLLSRADATVTMCHSRTRELPQTLRQADVVVSACGRAEMLTEEYFREGQVVLDVGINTDAEGKLCGDVCFAQAEPLVGAITPVPGGVGAVTSAVLMNHVAVAARRAGE